MKKWIWLAMGLLSQVAQAEQSLCGYKEYFHIESKKHPLFILSGVGDGDVLLSIISPTSFQIKDGPACKKGEAALKITNISLSKWCYLDILDGPFMNHPQVLATCSGVKYLSTTYDGFGSYSYTIKFE